MHRLVRLSVVALVAACAPRVVATAPALDRADVRCASRASGAPDSLIVVVSYPMRDGDALVGAGARRSIAALVDSLLRPACAGGLPASSVRESDPRAARDAIDEGAAVVLTSDPPTIAYARARTDLESVPLPWDRTYVLLVARSDTMASDTDSTAALRTALARDAVREEARPSAFWRNAPDSCRIDAPPGEATSSATTNRIVYRDDDPVARELAERLVALGESHSLLLSAAIPALAGDASLRTTPLAPADFTSAIATGHDAAYVLAVDGTVADACAASRALERAAPWADDRAGNSALVPLVDTRATAIVRRGVARAGGASQHAPAPRESTP